MSRIFRLPRGPELNLWILKRAYVDAIPFQHNGIQQALRDFPADIILADNFLFGALPMLLGSRSERPPIAMLGTMGLHLRRDDGAPPFAGLPPAVDDAQMAERTPIYEAHQSAFIGPINAELESCLRGMGIEAPTISMFDSTVLLPDAYLQLTVPSFDVSPCTTAHDSPVRRHATHPSQSGAACHPGQTISTVLARW